ncbi:hypothetical protein [Yersinia frederiksenii]|uniref:hypothetical protein n=1 Tax=Yersinia frederiksenii TaxID=29484 RepID=UPI00067D182F|nr:hypothetical protein [Yersinia frederiksenii]
MSSFSFTGNENSFVIRMPSGTCIQGGRASTDVNGYATVTLGLAMSVYSVIVGESYVSKWVQSENIYSAFVSYGSQIINSSTFGFRTVWWTGSDKTFRGGAATAHWIAVGKI